MYLEDAVEIFEQIKQTWPKIEKHPKPFKEKWLKELQKKEWSQQLAQTAIEILLEQAHTDYPPSVFKFRDARAKAIERKAWLDHLKEKEKEKFGLKNILPIPHFDDKFNPDELFDSQGRLKRKLTISELPKKFIEEIHRLSNEYVEKMSLSVS